MQYRFLDKNNVISIVELRQEYLQETKNCSLTDEILPNTTDISKTTQQGHTDKCCRGSGQTNYDVGLLSIFYCIAKGAQHNGQLRVSL